MVQPLSAGAISGDIANGLSGALAQENSAFGSLLRQMRDTRVPPLTQAQLAERIECSSGLISMLEKGQRRPTRRFIGQLVDALALPAEFERRLLGAAGFDMDPGVLGATQFLQILAVEDVSEPAAQDAALADLVRIAGGWQTYFGAQGRLRAGDVAYAQEQVRNILRTCDSDPTPTILYLYTLRLLADAQLRGGQLDAAEETITTLSNALDMSYGITSTATTTLVPPEAGDQRLQPSVRLLSAEQVLLLRAELDAYRGTILLRRGLTDDARRYYAASKEYYLALQLATPPVAQAMRQAVELGLGWSAIRLARLALFRGQEREALDACAQAETHLHRVETCGRQQDGLRRVTELTAWAYARLGQLEYALQLHDEARVLCEHIGDRVGILRNWLWAGDDLRRMIEARLEAEEARLARESVQQRKQLEPPFLEAPCAVLAALLEHDAGIKSMIERAAAAYDEALNRCERGREALLLGLAHRNRAVIHRLQGQYGEAEIHLQLARQQELQTQQLGRLPAIYEAAGDLAWDQGRMKEADEAYRDALTALDTLRSADSSANGETPANARLRQRVVRHLTAVSQLRTREVVAAANLHALYDSYDPFLIVSAVAPLDSKGEEDSALRAEWRDRIIELIETVAAAIGRHRARPVASSDLSREWLEALLAFEAIPSPRLLVQNSLSLSLAETLVDLPEHAAPDSADLNRQRRAELIRSCSKLATTTADAHTRNRRHASLRTNKRHVLVKDSVKPFHSTDSAGEFDPTLANWDLCYRPFVQLQAATSAQTYACVRGARALLHEYPAQYHLEAGLLPLPLGFTVKDMQVLIELPHALINDRQEIDPDLLTTALDLARDGTIRHPLCYRLPDATLANELRRLFPQLLALVQRSVLLVEPTAVWLDHLLQRRRYAQPRL